MNILLVIDEYPGAAEAALGLARERGASLTALFVLDNTWNEYLGSDWLSGSNSRGGFLAWVRDQEFAAEEMAETLFRNLAGDTPFTWKSPPGRVTDEILKEAAAGYDLIVLSNPLRRGLEVVRDGVEAVVRKAPCDVLLVRAPDPVRA